MELSFSSYAALYTHVIDERILLIGAVSPLMLVKIKNDSAEVSGIISGYFLQDQNQIHCA